MNKKTIEERVDEIVNKIAREACCKVCACENGKKVWCACHRKQIHQALTEHEARAMGWN